MFKEDGQGKSHSNICIGYLVKGNNKIVNVIGIIYFFRIRSSNKNARKW